MVRRVTMDIKIGDIRLFKGIRVRVLDIYEDDEHYGGTIVLTDYPELAGHIPREMYSNQFLSLKPNYDLEFYKQLKGIK